VSLQLAVSRGKSLAAPTPISLNIISHRTQYPITPELFNGSASTGLIQLTALLKNVSSSPVTISTLSEVVISVNSMKVNEQRIDPTPAGPVEFDDDPIFMAGKALRTLTPNEKIYLSINAVHTLVFSDNQYTELAYTPPTTGLYEIVLAYSYSGPDNNFPNVYHGVVAAPPISITVVNPNPVIP
jgi:hypothetical protein